MSLRLPYLFATFFALMSCSSAPDIGAQVSEIDRAAKFPSLLPLSSLIAAYPTVAAPSTQLVGTAALKARAAALRGPVLDPISRQKLLAAIERHRPL
ncbi:MULTISPECIES: hypothetical protein [Falsihalocynthiibacter]|uniref:hypothetical protein n=1 Tax=Falsihalocynthiibacter TaxID=2854182 RepID=UPI00300212CB